MRHVYLCFVLAAAAACSDPPKAIIDAGISDGPVSDGQGSGPVALPRAVDLGPVDCGGSTSATFTVTNDGTTDVTIALTSADPAFTVVPADVTIVVGTSTTFTVSASAPAGAIAGAPLTTTFTATTNIPGRPTVTFPVTATTRGARITINPPSLNFGDVGVGTSAQLSFVVSNTGNGPAMVAIADAAGADAQLTFGTAGVAAVGPGALVSGSGRFTPTTVGAYVQTAAVTVTGATCGGAPTSLAVTGDGVRDGGILIVGGPIDFPDVGCEEAATTQTLTIDNQSSAPAAFTAAFLVDAQGDQVHYTVTPASGTVAARATAVVTVTRLPVARPFVPRAIDATLRIVAGGVPNDVEVTQTIRAPFLTSDLTSQDFGFQLAESSVAAPVTVTNTGNATATLAITAESPFSTALPATLAAGADVDGELLYEPLSATPATATVTIDAVDACSAPIAIDATGGTGPFAAISIFDVVDSCPNPTGGFTYFVIDNPGTAPLTIDCVEDGVSGLDPVWSGLPTTVASGDSAVLGLNYGPGPTPPRAGPLTATLRCTTNEALTNVRAPTLTRTLEGADIELTAPEPLDFECFDGVSRDFATDNVGTQPVFLMPDGVLPFPLSVNFDYSEVGAGSGLVHTIDNSIPSFRGGGDLCGAAVGSGGLIWEGTIGVAAGSASNLCGVTPATLPVRLFDYAETPE